MIYIIIIAALIALLAWLISRQPNEFRITRSIAINAPVEKVFPQVNSFYKWEKWSPWAKLDLTAKNLFEGAAEGEGAIFTWDGNNKVGAGKMTIVESRPNELITIKLDFYRPFKANNTTEFVFNNQGTQTILSWSMFGKNNYLSKFMNLIINCDKMVGKQFEQGLAGIKQIAESN